MPDIHLRFGGSTATRTLKCPSWQNICDQLDLPPEPPGRDIDELIGDTKALGEFLHGRPSPSDRGTLLHAVMEQVYDKDADVRALIEHMPDDDADAVLSAHKAMEMLLNAKKMDEYAVEQFVQLADHQGGSIDMLACSDTQVAVIDFKFGFAPVKERDQNLFYAMCARNTPAVADMFENRELLTVIIQPAVSELPIVQRHEPHEVLAFEQDWARAMKIAAKGDTVGSPGDHCKYCPAAPTCPARRAQMYDFITADPATPEGLEEGMALVDQMKSQIKALEAAAFSTLERGAKVAGWKLVPKRSPRKFADPGAVRHKFRYSKQVTKDMYLEEPALKSVAQVEKALKRAGVELDLSPLVSDAAPGLTLAPEDDPRDAWVPVQVAAKDALDTLVTAGD